MDRSFVFKALLAAVVMGVAPFNAYANQTATSSKTMQPKELNLKLSSTPLQKTWFKICNQAPEVERTCYLTRDFITKEGQPVLGMALYQYPVNGSFVNIIRYIVPLGFYIPPGARSMIDNQVPFSGHFHACDQQGCLIQSDPLDEATLKRLKSGQTLELMVQDQVQNKVIFSIPLDGLTKGLSGPPTSQAQLAEHQKKLKEEFIKYTKKYAKTQQQQH